MGSPISGEASTGAVSESGGGPPGLSGRMPSSFILEGFDPMVFRNSFLLLSDKRRASSSKRTLDISSSIKKEIVSKSSDFSIFVIMSKGV
jgi:hypothetical protein